MIAVTLGRFLLEFGEFLQDEAGHMTIVYIFKPTYRYRLHLQDISARAT